MTAANLRWEDEPTGRWSELRYKGLRIVVSVHLHGEPGQYYGAVYGCWLSHSVSDGFFMTALGDDIEVAKRRWLATLRAHLLELAATVDELAWLFGSVNKGEGG